MAHQPSPGALRTLVRERPEAAATVAARAHALDESLVDELIEQGEAPTLASNPNLGEEHARRVADALFASLEAGGPAPEGEEPPDVRALGDLMSRGYEASGAWADRLLVWLGAWRSIPDRTVEERRAAARRRLGAARNLARLEADAWTSDRVGSALAALADRPARHAWLDELARRPRLLARLMRASGGIPLARAVAEAWQHRPPLQADVLFEALVERAPPEQLEHLAPHLEGHRAGRLLDGWIGRLEAGELRRGQRTMVTNTILWSLADALETSHLDRLLAAWPEGERHALVRLMACDPARREHLLHIADEGLDARTAGELLTTARRRGWIDRELVDGLGPMLAEGPLRDLVGELGGAPLRAAFRHLAERFPSAAADLLDRFGDRAVFREAIGRPDVRLLLEAGDDRVRERALRWLGRREQGGAGRAR